MTSQSDRERVVAVFPDQDRAQDAVRAAREAGADNIHVDDSEDEVAVVRSEMRDEAESARPGFFTPRVKRTVPLWMGIGAVAGVLIALAAAFFAASGVSVATRVLIAVSFGAAVGATVGFFYGVLVAGGLGRRWKGDGLLETERGVVVGADERTEDVAQALEEEGPIRVDRQ